MVLMTADQLLNRMLKFAASPECPPDRKREVENGSWKTWADSITEHNPFSYDKVKHEVVKYVDGIALLNENKIPKYKNYHSKPHIPIEHFENGIKIAQYSSVSYAAKKLGVTAAMIRVCLAKKNNKFTLKFKENEKHNQIITEPSGRQNPKLQNNNERLWLFKRQSRDYTQN
jgi:HD superfamily phosphohydrolase